MPRGRVSYVAGLSVLMLLPCYWQSRIQAGDLSSHIYNAWLAIQLERQPVPGLRVVPQWTNVLFDWSLTELLRRFGPDWAQRVAVSACVLVFFWGSFFLVRTLAQREVWQLTPLLGMLSYGWLFHSGFFNFYCSMGLCFFALAFWLRRQRILAFALLPPAFLGHALPVLWAAGAATFLEAARRFPRYAFPATAVLVAGVSLWVRSWPGSYWSFLQVTDMTGFDQLGVFTSNYFRLVMAVLAIVGVLFWRRVKQFGRRELLKDPEALLTAVLSLAMLLIPLSIPVPGKPVLLGMLPMRLSITVAICALGLIARAPIPRWVFPALTACLLVFGWMIYRDTAAYNRLEDRLEAELERSARGQKVVLAVQPITHQEFLQINLATHLIDRACVGRCFSYANYEPSTQVFRLRATAPNAAVMDAYGDSLSVQFGEYRAAEKDLPLLQVQLCGIGRPVRIRPVRKGEILGVPRCEGQ